MYSGCELCIQDAIHSSHMKFSDEIILRASLLPSFRYTVQVMMLNCILFALRILRPL